MSGEGGIIDIRARLSQAEVDLTGKQPMLVSGTTIKTLNGTSLLGAGDIVIVPGGGTPIPANTLTGNNTALPALAVPLTAAQVKALLAYTPADIGAAPTAHTHFLAAGATDVTVTVANLNTLDDGVNTALHFHDADRTRANHTGTQLAATISDFATAVSGNAAVALNTAKVTNASHTGDATGATVLTLATVNTNVGSFGLAGSVAQFVVNAKGLITSVVNVAISVTAAAISDSTAAGRAMVTALTATAQTALLDVFTTGAKGLVPASGGGTVNFLRADGIWSPLTVNRAYGQLAANYTLASAITVQKLFNWSTNGALTLATGRYQFSTMVYVLGMSATSGNAAFSLAGTATLANQFMDVYGVDSTTPLVASAFSGSAAITSATVASMIPAGIGTGMFVEISGMFNVTVAGTIIPSIQLVTASAAIVQAGSFFECVRIADTGVTTLGAWT